MLLSKMFYNINKYQFMFNTIDINSIFGSCLKLEDEGKVKQSLDIVVSDNSTHSIDDLTIALCYLYIFNK